MAEITPEITQNTSREDIINNFNQSIGLTSNSNGEYNSTPKAIDIYNKVVGNPVTGSNPGLNINRGASDLAQLNNNLQDIQSHKDNVSSLANNTVYQTDTSELMRPFSYNGDFDGANFERYYNSKPFKELGFSPYRDNESLYNNNMTVGDEFVRAAGQWPSLIKTGVMSGVKTWGNIFTDPLGADVKSSQEMARAMAIGSATKSPVSSFFINTFLNSGYTLGIGAEMLGETLLLAGATAVTGGLDIEATLPAWMVRATGAVKNVTEASKAAEKIRDLEKLKSIGDLKSFWNGSTGKVLGKIGQSINPLENTWNVVKDIKSGANAAEFTNATAGTINKFAQYSKNFGEFARDMVQIKAAVSEAQIEGGGVKVSTTKAMIDQFRENNGGLEPEGEDLREIERIADNEARVNAFWNLPAIMWSNKFMYHTLFSPFEKVSKEGIEAGIKAGAEQLFTKGVGFEVAKEGISGTLQKLGRNIKSKDAWKTFGYNYLKENSAEGVQENIQEALNEGAMSHAMAVYNNPDRSAYEGYMSHYISGVKDQFNAQGAETFAGGFVMGAMAHPFMAAPMWIGQEVWNKTIGKNKYEEFQKERREQNLKDNTSLNEIFKDPIKYFAPDMVNAIKQGNLSDNLYNANIENDRKKAEDIKTTSIYDHLYTALRTGKMDILLEQFDTYKDFTAREAADAFLGSTATDKQGAKALNMIGDVISRAEQIKENYLEVSTSFPNPYNPSKYKKDTLEKIAETNNHFAWEEAKKHLIFARTDFENHSKRIEQIASTLIGKRNPIKNANAQDLMMLTNKITLESGIKELARTIKTTDSSTAEGKKVINEAQKKYDLLVDLQNNFEKAAPYRGITETAKKSMEDGFNIEVDKINNTLNKSFKKYIKNIAKDSGDFVFDDQVEYALGLIQDTYNLRDEKAGLVNSINILNNPKGFLSFHKALANVFDKAYVNREKDSTERRDKFIADAQQNKAKNELYQKAGVFLTANYLYGLKNALDNKTIIESAKSFIDAEDPNLAVITQGPKFDKAKEVWDNIIISIQAEQKSNVKVLITPEMDYSDPAYNPLREQIDLLLKPFLDPKFNPEQLAMITRDLIRGPSEIQELIKKYNEVVNEKDPVIIIPGELIYATSGSGKTTLVNSAENTGNLIDADELIFDEIKRQVPEFEIKPDETIQDTLFRFSGKESNGKWGLVYNAVRKQIDDLKKEGKTIYTGSTYLIQDADTVLIQQDDSKVRAKGDSLPQLRKREQDAIRKYNKEVIPLESYLGVKKKEQDLPPITSIILTNKTEIIADIEKRREEELKEANVNTNINDEDRENLKNNINDEYDKKLALLLKSVAKTPDITDKLEYSIITAEIDGGNGPVTGGLVKLDIDPDTSYFVYEKSQGLYYLTKKNKGVFYFTNANEINAPIAVSSVSIEDAIKQGIKYISSILEEEKVNGIINGINEFVNTFNKFDKEYDDVVKNTATFSAENVKRVLTALDKRKEELMTIITLENLSQAKKRGFKIEVKIPVESNVNSGIISNFTVSIKKGTVTINNLLQTGKGYIIKEEDVTSQIIRITPMSEEKPITVTKQDKEDIKDASSKSTTILSSSAIQDANNEAKTKNVDQALNDLDSSIGCE